MQKFFDRLTILFPLWITIACVLSFYNPVLFIWFKGPLITWALGFIMLGMALTLDVEDFKRIKECPGWIFCGVGLQFFVMPLLGYFLSSVFNLSNEFAVGLILVSCCPGGTASNVISFLAKANVALSVSMTAISTLVAIIATPLLTEWLVGSRLEVNGWGLFLSTLKVVVLPLALGLLLKQRLPKVADKITIVSPFIAVVLIVLIVASVIGAGKSSIIEAALLLFLSVFLLHAFGFLFGYGIALIVTKDKLVSKTISIEVGMQNSGLGVVLARQNFSSSLVAIPSAVSSLCHCLIGSFMASIWSRSYIKEKSEC